MIILKNILLKKNNFNRFQKHLTLLLCPITLAISVENVDI